MNSRKEDGLPIYVYGCPTCGTERDQFNRIAERNEKAPVCCGAAMGIVPQVAYVFDRHKDFAAKSPVDGQVLTSHRQRRYYMESKGLIDARDAGMDPDSVIKREDKRIAKRKEMAEQATKLPNGVNIKDVLPEFA